MIMLSCFACRLVGCPPFWHRKQMYMLRAIMDGKYTFNSPEWEDISEPPKDLVSRTLFSFVWKEIPDRTTSRAGIFCVNLRFHPVLAGQNLRLIGTEVYHPYISCEAEYFPEVFSYDFEMYFE